MRMRAENTDSPSVAQFMGAMLLIADCALILRAEKWFAANHGPYVEGLTPRMYSFVDLSSWMMVFLAVMGIILFCKWAWALKR